MKLFKTTVKSLLSGLLCITMVAPMVLSCYDDTAIREELEGINGRLDDLEAKLNGQIQALNDLVAGGTILISSLDKKEDGSYVVTLSNGTKFSVLPAGTSVTGIVTYTVIDGVGYWAKYEADGTLKLILDDSGNKIPVETEVPTVKEKDGKFYLVIGGKEYETGFDSDTVVSIITDYEINKDETGNVYSVTFTFGNEGMTFTVPMKDYLGFSFRLGSAGQTRVIKDYYVAYASTSQIIAGMDGVVDYVLQIPDGWRVTEEKDELMGETYLNITAPSKAAVEAGDALAEGDLKVVAVVEGGKAMAARLFLTTSPFKVFTATATNAVMEIRDGVDKFVYGLVESTVDDAAIFAEAKSLLAANDKGVATGDINVPLSELMTSEFSSGTTYVLWAMPAFYDYSEESTGFFLKEGIISTYKFTYNNIKLENHSVSYNDAVIKLDMGGATAFWGGTELKSETWSADAITQINAGLMDTYSQPLTYEGSAFAFPVADKVTPEPGKTYVSWVVPFVKGKDTYIKDDIIYVEYTLSEIEAGSTLNVAAGDAVISRVSIDVPLSAEGAESIVYIFESERTAARYKTQDAQAEYLLTSGTLVNSQTCTASTKGLKPSTGWVLFAMAVDEDGKYGAVLNETYETETMKYNDIKVSLELLNNFSTKAEVKIDASVASEYIWWFGKETDTFWTSSEYCNKLRTDAEQYMALYPTDENIVRAMNNSVLADGVLTLTNLAQESTYVLLVLAKDQDGLYSKAGYTKFTTLAADLGEIVQEGSDKWKSAKEKIQIKFIPELYQAPEHSMGYAAYAYEYTGPTDMTAYILSGSNDYFTNNDKVRTVADQIIDVKSWASRAIDKDWSPENLPLETYYNDAGEEKKGNIVSYVNYGTHGLANWGAVTYFSSDHHGLSNCEECDDRANDPTAASDRSYEGQVASIKARATLDFYKNRAVVRYGLKNEESINKTAESLLSIYKEYYENCKPTIYINEGEPLLINQKEGIGLDSSTGEVIDAVIVVLRDADDNYYAPMFFPVENHF